MTIERYHDPREVLRRLVTPGADAANPKQGLRTPTEEFDQIVLESLIRLGLHNNRLGNYEFERVIRNVGTGNWRDLLMQLSLYMVEYTDFNDSIFAAVGPWITGAIGASTAPVQNTTITYKGGSWLFLGNGGAGTGSYFMLGTNASQQLDMAKDPECEFGLLIGANNTDKITEWGIGTGWNTTTASPTTTGCYFRYGTDDTVKAVTRTGGSETVSAALITGLTAGQFHRYRVRITGGGTAAEFYIDDVLMVTHTTNIPPALGSDKPGFATWDTAAPGNTHSWLLDFCWVMQQRYVITP